MWTCTHGHIRRIWRAPPVRFGSWGQASQLWRLQTISIEVWRVNMYMCTQTCIYIDSASCTMEKQSMAGTLDAPEVPTIEREVRTSPPAGNRRGHATPKTCMPPGPSGVPGLEPQGPCHHNACLLARNRRPSSQPAIVPRWPA